MGDPRDPVDSWLQADVELLQPRPGTFERVSRRARRRKAIHATMTAAGAAVIIAGLAAAPGLASFLPGTRTGQAVNGASSHSASQRAGPASPTASGAGPLPLTSHPALPGTGARLASPAFRPSSVTFIGPNVGAVLGTGSSAACPSARCVAIAGTNSYGRGPWFDVGAPPTGSSGVSQLRFGNVADGWAFGPSLWFTRNGGRSWAPSAVLGTTTGTTVIDVAALDHLAFALVGNCSGAGADFGAHCTSVTLYRAVAGTDSWHPVGGAVNLTTGGASPRFGVAASLILAGSGSGNPAADAGYLLTPGGGVIGGSVASAAWHSIGMPASVSGVCTPGGPQPDGQPTQEMAAAPKAGELYLVCNTSAAVPNKVYTWLAGRGWQQAGVLPPPSFSFGGGALAAAPDGTLVLASYLGIQLSTDNGRHWRLVQRSPGGTGSLAGFRYVGLTNLNEGVAVPADSSLGEIFVTTDGGRSWSASRI